MKLSPVIVLAAVASGVAAESCSHGGVYCGISLLHKGNYKDHIIRVLKKNGQPPDQRHILYSKFDCLGGGEIAFDQFCANGCGGVDSEDPDYCL